MNMEAFADEIRKQNRQHSEGGIRVLLALCGVYTMGNVFDSLGVYTGMKLFTALLYGFAFHRLYLSVITEEPTVKLKVRKYLDRVIKPHTFSRREYFSYIRRKQIAGQAAVIVIGIAAAVMRKDAMEAVVAVVTGIIPTVVSFVEQFLFAHRTTSRTMWGEEAALNIWRGILSFAQFVVCFAGIVFLYFIGYAVISDTLAPGLKDGVVIYRRYTGYLYYVCAMLFAMFLYCYLFEVRRRWKRIAAGFFAAGLLMTLTEEHFFYIDTCLDRIAVSDFSGRKEYGFDEIEKFTVFPEDRMLQAEVSFKDGTKAKLFGGTVSTTTDAWDRKYFSEYDYMAQLAPLFFEGGAQGKIREIEEMRKGTQELDPQIQEAMDQIISLLEEGE